MKKGIGVYEANWGYTCVVPEKGKYSEEAVRAIAVAESRKKRREREINNLRQQLMHEVRYTVLEITKKGGRTLSDMINEICTRLEEKRATVESGIPEEGIRGDSTFTEENFRKMVDDMLRRAAENVLRGNSKIADGYDERQY